MIQRWRAPSRMKLPASAWLCKKTSSGSGGDRAPGPDTLPPFYRKIYGVVRRVARPGVPEACEIVAVEHLPGGHLDPTRPDPRPLGPYDGERPETSRHTGRSAGHPGEIDVRTTRAAPCRNEARNRRN